MCIKYFFASDSEKNRLLQSIPPATGLYEGMHLQLWDPFAIKMNMLVQKSHPHKHDRAHEPLTIC